MMKKWLILMAVAAVAGGGWVYWHQHQAAHPGAIASAAAPGAVHAPTALVEKRNISFVLTSAGDVGPADQVSVRPEINGKISSLPVDIGDQVKKGDLLFSLDDRDLQTQRSSCLTDIEGTKLTLEKMRRNYNRSKVLFADHLLSQEVYEDSKTDFEMAENTLEKSRKTLVQVEDQLSKTRIIAPFDCTVLTRPVSMGQAVSGSAGFNSGTEVLTIANLKDMIVNAHVNQADVVRMVPGQTADLEVEAVPGLKFKGIVDRIAPQATIKNNIKGFATQILLTNIDRRVRPGMTANLSISLASAENVVAVPLAAVFTEMNERYVYVKKEDESYEIRPIHIGVADYQYAEILDGVTAGETVSLVRPPDSDDLKLPTPVPAKTAKPAMHGEKAGATLLAQPSANGTNKSSSVAKSSVL